MAASEGTLEQVTQAFDDDAKRRYAAGALHAVLHQQAKTMTPMIHVELHTEAGQPTGDLVLRLYGLAGEWRVRLEAMPVEEPF